MEQGKVTQYFERNKDLRVLFVFDPIGDILNEIEAFAWESPYKVVRFVGDWFVTKCDLAQLKDGERCITSPPSSPIFSRSAAASCTALIAASSTTPSGSSTSVSQERT